MRSSAFENLKMYAIFCILEDVNVLWGDGHCTTIVGYGLTTEEVAKNFLGANGPLKGAAYANNCWTWDGKTRTWGSWNRP